MTMFTRIAGALFAVLTASALMIGSASAQANFVTPGGAGVDGKVEMCLNSSGQAVPCSDPTATPIRVSATNGTYSSAGAAQYGLAIGTNTQLTVPAGTKCAFITVETANVRRTSDGVSASTTVGTLMSAGAQWTDCGPLAAYKFTAVSGSPTLDVEYFK